MLNGKNEINDFYLHSDHLREEIINQLAMGIAVTACQYKTLYIGRQIREFYEILQKTIEVTVNFNLPLCSEKMRGYMISWTYERSRIFMNITIYRQVNDTPLIRDINLV